MTASAPEISIRDLARDDTGRPLAADELLLSILSAETATELTCCMAVAIRLRLGGVGVIDRVCGDRPLTLASLITHYRAQLRRARTLRAAGFLPEETHNHRTVLLDEDRSDRAEGGDSRLRGPR